MTDEELERGVDYQYEIFLRDDFRHGCTPLPNQERWMKDFLRLELSENGHFNRPSGSGVSVFRMALIAHLIRLEKWEMTDDR